MTSRIILSGIAAIALMAACATTPKTVTQLEEARAAVGRFSADPLAAQSASRELQAAREALARADRAFEAKEPLEQIVHLAYLAERQAEIGEARLAELRARQQIARAEAARNEVLLQARERQAERRAREAQEARESATAARTELKEMQRRFKELEARPTERGMVLTLGDVLFDTAKANLKAGAAETLNRLAKFMHENPESRIVIEGHTDARGSDEYNMQLSRARAAAVAEALEVRGVGAERMDIEGLGESLPVASNDTASGRQRNRRVEIVFSDRAGRFAEGPTSGAER